MSSRPSSSRQRAFSSSSNGGGDALGAHLAGHQVDGDLGRRVGLRQLPQASTVSCGSTTVSRPFFSELPRKMSANRDEITALKP